MAKTTLIHGDAADYAHLSADIMLTDPPFEMSGEALAGIINRYPVQHLVFGQELRRITGEQKIGLRRSQPNIIVNGEKLDEGKPEITERIPGSPARVTPTGKRVEPLPGKRCNRLVRLVHKLNSVIPF